MKAGRFLLAALFSCSATQALAAQDAPASDAHRVTELQARLQADPASTDLMRQLAEAQAAALQYDAALATIERARALAPADNDIALTRARILLWSGRLREAKAEAGIVRARAPGYPEMADVDASISAALAERQQRSGMAVSTGIAGVNLAGGGSQGWETLSLSGFTAIDEHKTLTATIEHEARRESDTRLSLLATHVSPTYELRLGASLTPNADFRENWSIQAGADFRIHPNVALLADMRYADYANLSVISALPGVRLHSSNAEHALSLRLISIFRSDGDGDGKVGASARYDGELGNDLRVFGGGASYPDTEAGITRQMRSVFAGVARPLSTRTSLSMTGEYDRRARSYTRKAIILSLVVRFGD